MTPLVAIGVPVLVVGGALAADLVINAKRGNPLLVRGWWLNLMLVVVASVGVYALTHQRAAVFATVMVVGFGLRARNQRQRGRRR